MAKTIATLLHGRDNNFNLIRFTAASAVLLDHSFALVAQGHAAGGLIDMERLEIGRLAVDVFFIVSGFLVTRSVLTQPTLVDYAVARFLRLFPALLVATIGIAFVLGPLVTSVSWQDYFSDPRPWLYVPLTASLITHSLTLPGVFDTVPEAGVIDPPLWTLRYETMCYVLLALFAGLGMLATRTRAGLTLALILAVYVLITFATPLRGDSRRSTARCASSSASSSAARSISSPTRSSSRLASRFCSVLPPSPPMARRSMRWLSGRRSATG